MFRRLLNEVLSRPALVEANEPRDRLDNRFARVRELIAEKRLEMALSVADIVVRTHPEDASSHVLQAEVLRRLGRSEDAKRAYRAALLIDPERADAWLDLGICHYLAGDYFWARLYYRYAAALQPANADVWNELGLVEIQLGNFEKSEQSLEKAVSINPDHAEAWNNLGLVAARRGALRKAKSHFSRATMARSEYYMAFANLGLACRELELFDEAASALNRAIQLEPSGIDALLNLALVHQDQESLGDALNTLERARNVSPQDPRVLAAMSAVRLRLGEAHAAEAIGRAALAIDVNHPEARLALAHAQLAQNNFTDGWENYEARLRTAGGQVRHTPLRDWRGESLLGQSIYVYGEQGLGDEIMFASCLPDLVAAGTQCFLDCDHRLRPIFSRSFPRIEVLADTRTVLPFDGSNPRGIRFCLPIGSLPRFFRPCASSYPGSAYLRADEEKVGRWSDAVRKLGRGLKIGIVWRGGLARTGRRQRSLELPELRQLFEIPDIRWVSLQHGLRLGELENFDYPLLHWPEALRTTDDTAALLTALDAVVTVCSTTVHLGGALGRPVFVLTPFAPAWRYGLSGDSMHWYRSVKLCRQDAAGTWGSAILQVADELRRLAR